MTPEMKRRLTVFGAGFLLGLPLAIGLFQYATSMQAAHPRETHNVEVVLTTCALAAGDVFEERCVERRVVAEQFVPPGTISADQVGMWIGRKLRVPLETGSAVRTEDFESSP